MARKTFKKILALCYDEDFEELHKELLSLEVEVRKSKDYHWGIDEAYRAIELYAGDEFPEDTMDEIKVLYEEYLESLEF